MCKGNSGLYKGTKGAKFSKKELHLKAENAIAELISSTPGARKKSMVIGAYDISSGKTIAAFAGKIPNDIHPKLIELANQIGGIGSYGLTERNTVGVCAEFQVVNRLLLSGSQFEDIRLTKAIRPRTGEVIPYCENCVAMFKDLFDD